MAADNEFVIIDEEGGGDSGDSQSDGIQDVTFGDDEGETFEPGGTPEDRGQDLVDSFDPTDPLPDGPLGGGSLGTLEDGPSIVGPGEGLGGDGDGSDEDAIREALTEETLSKEERERLEQELRDARLRNNQDNIDRRVDPEGEGGDVIEPVFD